nr:MAG TPA: hypothetical protein [Caudoviricetes sp.]
MHLHANYVISLVLTDYDTGHLVWFAQEVVRCIKSYSSPAPCR